ncbi:MAG: hypothetical protein ACXVPK_09640 [Tumebacillaceae bacterium]
MNKKTKRFLIGTMMAAVVASGAVFLTNTSDTFAAAPKPAPTAVDTHHDGIGCTAPQPPADGRPAPSAPDNNKPQPPNNAPSSDSITATQGDLTITISGGHATDPRDKGRPVVLVASALGVPSEVFRDAFSGVTPAGLDRNPTPEEAQRNKAALLKVLSPYGITNDRLDEVSNFYRYNGQQSKTWRVTPATVKAIETNGVVTGIQITNPGAGYSSTPTITIKGPNGTVTATTTVSYTQDFTTNGSLATVTLQTK